MAPVEPWGSTKSSESPGEASRAKWVSDGSSDGHLDLSLEPLLNRALSLHLAPGQPKSSRSQTWWLCPKGHPKRTPEAARKDRGSPGFVREQRAGCVPAPSPLHPSVVPNGGVFTPGLKKPHAAEVASEARSWKRNAHRGLDARHSCSRCSPAATSPCLQEGGHGRGVPARQPPG